MSPAAVRARSPRPLSTLPAVMIAAGGFLACDEDNGSSSFDLDDPSGTWEHVAGELPLLSETLQHVKASGA